MCGGAILARIIPTTPARRGTAGGGGAARVRSGGRWEGVGPSGLMTTSRRRFGDSTVATPRGRKTRWRASMAMARWRAAPPPPPRRHPTTSSTSSTKTSTARTRYPSRRTKTRPARAPAPPPATRCRTSRGRACRRPTTATWSSQPSTPTPITPPSSSPAPRSGSGLKPTKCSPHHSSSITPPPAYSCSTTHSCSVTSTATRSPRSWPASSEATPPGK
uniref:Uncharacterized protein n=1 Tax=Oryza brachyantha TaxID=4533 RepID=J3LKN9_ORYBR